MARQRRGVRHGWRAGPFPAAFGLPLGSLLGGVPQVGTRDRQRRLDAPISTLSYAGAFDASAVADAGLGRGDTDRPGLKRLAVTEAHPAPRILPRTVPSARSCTRAARHRG